MANFNELLQQYVNQSYDELLGLAKYSLGKVTNEITTIFEGSENASKALLVVTAACFGADMKLTTLEYTFLRDLLGGDWDYSSTKEMVEALGGEDSMEMTDKLVDGLSADGKAALVSFCLCLLSVDETISRDEVAFVAKLMD